MKHSSFLTYPILKVYRKLILGHFPIGQKAKSTSGEPRPGRIASKGKEEFAGFQISLSSSPPFLSGQLPRLGNELE